MINQETTFCEICSTEIKYYPSTRPNPRFCSYKCMGLANRGRTSSLKLNLPVDKIVLAYTSGQTTTQIAQRYATSVPTIISRLKEAGIERRKQTGVNFRTPSSIKKARENHTRGQKHPGYRDLPIEQIAIEYQAGESTITLAKKYNVAAPTIGKKLKRYGVKLRPRGFGHPRKCLDGHIVSSRWEQAVDNWLFRHNLEHKIHPICPWQSIWPSRPLADFLVQDFYIEVWGIEGNSRYDQRRLEKIKKYKECNAKLLEIFPHHILDKDYSPLKVLL